MDEAYAYGRGWISLTLRWHPTLVFIYALHTYFYIICTLYIPDLFPELSCTFKGLYVNFTKDQRVGALTGNMKFFFLF